MLSDKGVKSMHNYQIIHMASKIYVIYIYNANEPCSFSNWAANYIQPFKRLLFHEELLIFHTEVFHHLGFLDSEGSLSATTVVLIARFRIMPKASLILNGRLRMMSRMSMQSFVTFCWTLRNNQTFGIFRKRVTTPCKNNNRRSP